MICICKLLRNGSPLKARKFTLIDEYGNGKLYNMNFQHNMLYALHNLLIRRGSVYNSI